MTATIEHEAVHLHFGLSYANYLVLHRTLLQSMPDEWQTRFVGCLRELDDAFSHIKQAEAYKVEAAREREVQDLTADDLGRIGYSKSDGGCDCRAYIDPLTDRIAPVPAVCPHVTTYYDDRGTEVPFDHLVLWPAEDPVPHYNRGRTHLEPCPAGATT